MKLPAIPRMSDHGSEIVLLGLISVGVFAFMLYSVSKGLMLDVAACLVVEQGIVSAIKERWTQRSVDRMGVSLANSPPSEPPAQNERQQQPTKPVKP